MIFSKHPEDTDLQGKQINNFWKIYFQQKS